MQAGSDQQGARQLQKIWPPRSNAHQRARRSRQPARERCRYGTHLQCDQLGSGRQCLPYHFRFAGKNNYHCALHRFMRFTQVAVLQAAVFDWERDRFLHLEGHDSPEFRLRFDEQEMIGRLQIQPLAQTFSHTGKRCADSARGAKEACNHLVKCQRRRQRDLWFALPDVDTAAMTEFHPTLSLQLPVTGADCIRVKAKPTRQFPCAGQALSGSQIVAQNTQNDLSHHGC